MEFRSKSCRDERVQIENQCGGKVAPTSMQDLRCYSVNNASSCAYQQQIGKEVKVKKGKSTDARPSKSWSFSDPELQRKKRVAGYKIYAAEGKMKGSLRKSFRWIKNTYTQAVYEKNINKCKWENHSVSVLFQPILIMTWVTFGRTQQFFFAI
ncbi:hypothetical protein CR513_61976, partial [Mucuna pruriens]